MTNNNNNSQELPFPLNVEYTCAGGPTKSYIICSVPRSGSTLLARGLTATKIAGTPMEYFLEEHIKTSQSVWKFKNYNQYLGLLLSKKTTPNGVFGVKTHYRQLRQWFTYKMITKALPNLRFIYISRNDHIRQAISYSKALQTNIFYSEQASNIKAEYSFELIRSTQLEIEHDEESWEHFFQLNDINPFRITYEDFASSYEESIAQVLQFLEITTPKEMKIEPPPIKKLGDQSTDRWAEIFQIELSNKNHHKEKKRKSWFAFKYLLQEKIYYPRFATLFRRRFSHLLIFRTLARLILKIRMLIIKARGKTPFNALY